MSSFESLTRFATVTPNDSTDISNYPDWSHLIVGVAGNVAIDTQLSTNVVVPLPAGVHKIAVKRVRSTGTTATGLVVAG